MIIITGLVIKIAGSAIHRQYYISVTIENDSPTPRGYLTHSKNDGVFQEGGTGDICEG
jgi:hypothetical protein